MNEEWRNELVTKGTAYEALANLDQYAEVGECLDAIKGLPPTQPDDEETNYWHEKANSYEQTLVKLSQNIAKQPQRMKGKWMRGDIKRIQYCCSVCSGRFDYEWKYCPNCGADMKGE